MDSGAAHSHYFHLVGLLPSTYPPPLGEGSRWSRQTTSHIDSHTMGDHEDEISELPSSLHEVEEEYPTPTYDPSPDIPTYSGYDPSHDIPTHSRYDPSPTGHWYWMPSDETNHELASTSYVIYDMSGIPAHDSVLHVESEFEPNTMPGALPFLSMWRDLGTRVTLHLPS